MRNAKVRTAIFISGRGSNMEAIVRASKKPDYLADIVLVFSNNEKAAGLEFARRNGLETASISHQNYDRREDYDRKIDQLMTSVGIELICLAGFMRMLSPWFTRQWAGKILNIHPSLLPKFKGLKAQRQALLAGEHESGCTVHIVNENMDDGRVLGQSKVKIEHMDDEELLSQKILVREHELYPRILNDYCRDLSSEKN